MIDADPIEPLPESVPWSDPRYGPNGNYGLTGWPDLADCPVCGGEAVQLDSMHSDARYECRGHPSERPPKSAYSPDHCQGVFVASRQHGLRWSKLRPAEAA